MSISQVSAKYGISLRTLRFYEERELISPARSGANRLYSERDCFRIEAIIKGRRLGLTLKQINKLIGAGKYSSSQHDIVMSMTRDLLSNQLKALLAKRLSVQAAIDDLVAARDNNKQV